MSVHHRAVLAAAIACVAVSVGCSFQESVTDGFYGGISDTIAGTISTIALSVLGVE